MNSIFLEILTFSKLDLTDMYLTSSSGISMSEKIFEIQPRDFLRYAKEDFNDGNERGKINSITNAKRAIDCQLDEVLVKLLRSSSDFKPSIRDFIDDFEIEPETPFKLKLINALNLAPSILISKSRTLRNKLEHEYKKPNVNEVKEALEIADLFLRSVTAKFAMIWTDFEISDDKENEIKIQFDPNSNSFEFSVFKKNQLEKTYFIQSDNIEYFYFLRLMFSIDEEIEINKTIKGLLTQIGHQIPIEKINILLYD